MAVTDAISSDMARVLLKKVKNQDQPASSGKKEEEEIQVIIKQLKKITVTLDKDSKEASESRALLIKELIKSFEDKGMSIKEQKEVLIEVNENLHENLDILKTLNIGNLNKFFTTFSDPKLLGQAINKGLINSNIAKAIDMLPNIMSQISGSITKMVGWASTVVDFIAHPLDHLKSFGSFIVNKTAEVMTEKLKQFGNFIWKSAIKPILKGLAKLTVEVIAIGIQMTALLVRMAISLVLWIGTVIVPLLFSIIGFILFTVVPLLFGIITSIVTFIIFTVIPFLITIISTVVGGIATIIAAIAPILLIAAAVLIIGILLGYLLYLAYTYVKRFVLYIFSQEFLDDVMNALKVAFNWVWDNIIEPTWTVLKDLFNTAWEAIMDGVDAVTDFFVDTVWGEWISPAIDSVTDTIMWVWDNFLEPVFTWISDIFMSGWEAAVEIFDYIKSALDKVFGSIGKLGEGLSNVASSVTGAVGGAISSAWKWTTSFFATGGIVTKPTKAIIGEGGTNEAVIPLDKKGMQFIRDSFGVDSATLEQIISSSDLFKNQIKIQQSLDLVAKDVEKIKFSLAEIKKQNSIQNPGTNVTASMSADTLRHLEEDPKQIFDIKEVEKLLSESDETMIKKFSELMELIKSTASPKQEPLLNPGSSPNDSYQDLVRIISTGIVGVR
jgi:DNA-binding transcriptional MerR regulator